MHCFAAEDPGSFGKYFSVVLAIVPGYLAAVRAWNRTRAHVQVRKLQEIAPDKLGQVITQTTAKPAGFRAGLEPVCHSILEGFQPSLQLSI